MKTDLVRVNRIPADWGLEVGSLAEVFRNVSLKRICQVISRTITSISTSRLSPRRPEGGLLKMCSIYPSRSQDPVVEGVNFSESIFKYLLVTYLKNSPRYIRMYEDDAAINGLIFQTGTQRRSRSRHSRVALE